LRRRNGLLHDGIDTAGELPADRWDAEPLLDTHPYTPGKMFTRYGNFLADISSLDPQFFGIAPREAHPSARGAERS
jgi:acyl transferase domain-containing protein